MKWVWLLLVVACGPHERAVSYGTRLQACVTLPTEAEVDACMCSVGVEYGRVEFLEHKGIQCKH